MFNIGGGELLVIMILALVVLGPKRLPDAARQIGKTMGDLRRLSTSFQDEVRTALDTADDPNRISDRRNVLAKDPPPAAATTEPPPVRRPARRTPLVAADPAPEPTRAKAPTAKKAAAKNGTKVAKARAPKAAPRRAKT